MGRPKFLEMPGMKGVRWLASLKHVEKGGHRSTGRMIRIGYFDSEIEAARGTMPRSESCEVSGVGSIHCRTMPYQEVSDPGDDGVVSRLGTH